MKIPRLIKRLVEAVTVNGGSVYLVGGMVHDSIWNSIHRDDLRINNDLDLAIGGLSPDQTKMILSTLGSVKEVGEQFAVFDMRFEENGVGYDMQVSHFRKERPMTDSELQSFFSLYGEYPSAQQAFVMEFDKDTLPFEDMARRAWTTKSAMINLHSGELLDYYGAVEGIRTKTVDAISFQTFVEDPVRVLILMGYIPRYGMTVTENLKDACKSVAESVATNAKEITKERIFKEFWKLAGYPKPSRGIDFLTEVGWSSTLGSNIELSGHSCNIFEWMEETPQDKEWHPEGNLLIHSLLAMDRANELAVELYPDDMDRVRKLTLAALFHDAGKLICTREENGHIVSKEHTVLGEKVLEKVFQVLGILDKHIQQFIIECAREHMFHVSLAKGNTPYNPKKIVRRFQNRVSQITLQDIAIIMESDSDARPPLEGGLSQVILELLQVEKEMEIEVDMRKPMINGKIIIEVLGINPSPLVGEIKEKADDAFLDGLFLTLEEGKKWLLENALELKNESHE